METLTRSRNGRPENTVDYQEIDTSFKLILTLIMPTLSSVVNVDNYDNYVTIFMI